jgi:hypothetical protein
MEGTLNIIASELGLIIVPNKASSSGQDVSCLVSMRLNPESAPEARDTLGWGLQPFLSID